MSKPGKDSKVTRRQLAEMRQWREEFGQSVRQATVRNKSTKDNSGTLPINCYFVKPQRLDFGNLLSMAPDSDEEDPVAPSSSNLFLIKYAFVVIKPGYQPSRLLGAPFFLGKCKSNVKASERKLTLKINSSPSILFMRSSTAKLKSVAHCVKLRMFALRMMSWHCMKMNILCCVIDCLDYGDQTSARESAEIGDVSEEAEASNKVGEVRTSETTVRTTQSGRTLRPQDRSLYLFYD